MKPKEKAKGENGREYALRSDLRPDPDQPRKDFPKEKILELSENISANGIQEDLLVRPDPEKKTKYMLVDGECRWRACGLAKIERVPIRVREMSDEEARKYQRISGTQRNNLTALEEAADLARELAARQQADAKFTPEMLGKEMGIKRSTVYNRLKLTRLHEPVRAALTSGEVDVVVAGEVAKIPDPAMQEALLKEITNTEDRRYPFSFRAVQQLIEQDYVRQLTAATFDTEDAKLVAKCGACSDCPKLSGNMKALFPEIKNAKVCTDLKCFRGKTDAHNAKTVAAAKEDGQTVLSEKECAAIFYGPEYGSRAGEMQYSSDYIDLENRCEPMGYDHEKKWRTALGKLCPKPVIAVDALGGLHELLKKSEAMEGLKATGWKPARDSYSNGMSAAEKAAQSARQKKEKLFKETFTDMVPKILAKLTTEEGPHVKLWPHLAQAAFDGLDIDRHDFMAKRMGISTKANESRPALDKWFKENHTTADYVKFTVEMLLLSRPIGGGYQKVEWDERTLLVARMGGANLEELAKEKQPELSARKKNKKKKGK